MLKDIKIKYCAIAILGSAILAFGLYNIHSLSGVTEGGVIGLNLLLDHWLNISPAITNLVANAICYLLGWRILGRKFIIYSAISTAAFSLFYLILEQFSPLWPEIADHPLIASVIGAIFVGVGVGICIRVGGAVSGDDALAMSISHLLHIKIQWVYLVSDVTILALSLSYIPISRIAYSLLTVVISGQIIGIIQRIGVRCESTAQKNKPDNGGNNV